MHTPLHLARLLASDSAANPDLPASVRADFSAIGKHLELAARLVDDLDDPGRFLRGTVPLEKRPVDLHLALQDALTLVRTDLETRHLLLDLAFSVQPPIVRGDEVRLRQLFWYVLKHAADHTPDSGRLRVQTHCAADRGLVVVTVGHAGQGLTPEELARVFSPGQPDGGAAEGTVPQFVPGGFGLVSARMIAEGHAGHLRATSAGRDLGTEFTLELPLDAAPVPREVAGPSEIPPRARPRILLVDDHAPTRNTLAQMLGRRHYEVIAAASVAEGRALGAAGGLQLLISDIGLPDGDGYVLMAHLRNDNPELPGIALSGYGQEEDVARSRNAGFTEHLVKPVNLRALEAAISRILASSRETSTAR